MESLVDGFDGGGCPASCRSGSFNFSHGLLEVRRQVHAQPTSVRVVAGEEPVAHAARRRRESQIPESRFFTRLARSTGTVSPRRRSVWRWMRERCRHSQGT